MTNPFNGESESLLLRSVDVDVLAERVATIVAERILPELGRRQRRLVDRHEMAKLAGISVPVLDRLVAKKLIPSSLVGTRRLFEPDAVLDSLSGGSGEALQCKS
jgi:hypothetical protein